MKAFFNSICLILIFHAFSCLAQSNISGIVNSYAQVTFISPGCTDSVTVLSSAGFAAGDSILIIQMQGAVIDSSNTPSFGTIMSYSDCGNYEFLKIGNIVGNIIHFTSSLTRSYSVSGKVQLITLPQYTNATVTGTLTAQPWNGSTGGVLALSISDTLTLNADINMNGVGFRGGIAPNGSFNCGQMNYYYASSSLNGGYKGEGIARYILGRETGRGSQANGGGGGNNNNSGGAGGGNYNMGGRGGNQVLYASCTPLLIGGEPGRDLNYSALDNKIFLGGGGGSGHQNDNNNVGINGTNGGGITFIRSNTITGNNYSIANNGLDNLQYVSTDGAGGGGAGGTILLNVQNFVSNLNLEVRGGKGGSSGSSIYCLGTGGGGSGGSILFNGGFFPSIISVNIQGGLAGVNSVFNSSCSGSNWGAANGGLGSTIFNWTISQDTIIAADAGINAAICAGQNIQIGTSPIAGLTYQWSNGINTAVQQVSPSVSTTYFLTVSNGVCVFAYDSVTISIAQGPNAAFSFSQNCNTLSFSNNSNGAISYQWYFGDGDSSVAASPLHSYSQPGNYQVLLIATNSQGCKDSAQQIVNVTQQNLQTSFSYAIDTCSQLIQLTSTVLNGNYYTWVLQDSLGIDTVTGNTTFVSYTFGGTLNVTHIVSNFCETDSLFMVIDKPVVQTPAAQFAFSYDHCSQTVSFTNQSANGVNYEWNFGDGMSSTLLNPVHTYSLPGSYTVTLIAINSCGTDTVAVAVTDTSSVTQAFFNYSSPRCTGEVSFHNKSQYALGFQWDFGDGASDTSVNPTHQYLIAGDYTVVLIANPGLLCADTLIQLISIMETDTATLFVPNIFTPNGDGLNESFEIAGTNTCIPYHLKIYNRWGSLIFETTDITNFWNGKHKGKAVPAGVYYYVLTGGGFTKHGSVSVIR